MQFITQRGSPVRDEFPEVPKDYKLICGVSMGYATEHRVNTFNPGRRAPAGSFGFSNETGGFSCDGDAGTGAGAGVGDNSN